MNETARTSRFAAACALGLAIVGVALAPAHADKKKDDALRAILAQGDQYRKSGSLDKAIEEYQKALELDDSNAEVYGRLGHALLDSGNPERAMKIFERQIALAPKECPPRAGLASAYLAQGLPDQAVKTCEDALKLCPDEAGAYFHLGEAYASAKYPIEAIEAFRRSAELDPKNLVAYEWLGKLYFDRKLYPEAAGMYEALLARFDLGKDDARSAFARGRLGFIYQWAHLCERAVPHWEAAIASAAADPETRALSLEGLARCRADLGQTSRAIELYQRLVAEQPKNADHYYRLGDLLNEAGRPAEALDVAKQGKVLEGPCPSQAYCVAGRAYEKLGGLENLRRAEREFQQAVACDDPRFRDDARKQVDRLRQLVKAEESKR